MPRPLEDLTGRIYGSWTVLARDPEDHPSETYWICQCSCGSRASIAKSNLVRGRSTQCRSCSSESLKKPKPKRKFRPAPKRGPIHQRWKGEDISYSTAHQRVVRARGKARTYDCVDCGSQAADWSFSKPEGCALIKLDDKGRPYCTHPEHYEPRCRDCHNRFDH